MDFNEYLKNALAEDEELQKEYNALQPEYEIIKKLIEVRIENGLTQKELAKLCGIKQSNISRLESGKGNPTMKMLKKIANSLDCDLVIEFKKREAASKSTFKTMDNDKTIVTVVAFPQNKITTISKQREYVTKVTI